MSFEDVLNEKINTWLFSANDRVEIYMILKEMLENGISLPNSVEKFVLGKKSFGMEKDTTAFIMEKVYKKLASGSSNTMFSKSIADYIPEDEFMVLFGAEENGLLENGLRDAIYMIETKSEITGTIKSSLAVPMMLGVIAFAMMYVVQFEVMTIIKEILDYDKWPSIAKQLDTVSLFVVTDGPFVVLALVGLVFAFKRASASLVNPAIRKYLDFLPLFKEYKQMAGASLLLSLSAMLAGGTSFSDALKTLKKYSPPYLQGFVQKSLNIQAKGGKNGGNGEALNMGLFNKKVSFSIYVYGDLSDFQKALYVISKKSSEDLLAGIKGKLKLINMIAMSSIVATILSMLYMISELTVAMQSAAT